MTAGWDIVKSTGESVEKRKKKECDRRTVGECQLASMLHLRPVAHSALQYFDPSGQIRWHLGHCCAIPLWIASLIDE